MSQNSLRLSWTREEVDDASRHHDNIFNTAKTTAEHTDLVPTTLQEQIVAAFENVANAMIAQGIV